MKTLERCVYLNIMIRIPTMFMACVFRIIQPTTKKPRLVVTWGSYWIEIDRNSWA